MDDTETKAAETVLCCTKYTAYCPNYSQNPLKFVYFAGWFMVIFKLRSRGMLLYFFRSTSLSRPNKLGLKCPSVRPSSVHKKVLWLQWNLVCTYIPNFMSMHDSFQHDPIQGQGHKPLKVRNSAIFKGYLLPHL